MTTTAPAPAFDITDEQKRQYREDGYFVLENVIPHEHLEMLRRVCAEEIERMDAEMDRKGTGTVGISHRGRRYFISNRSPEVPALGEFLFSELMADICRATLGEPAYLFNEQFVVKGAERGMKFGWHQDSGYIGHPHREYLSCWCALDDMSEANGTVYMLPYSRAGVRATAEHQKEEDTNDLVGYFGDDAGEPVFVPAGSIAVFSSNCFHRSGTNTTDRVRRSYLAQYSAEPILRPADGTLWSQAVPFLPRP